MTDPAERIKETNTGAAPSELYNETLALLALGSLHGVGYRILHKITSARLTFCHVMNQKDAWATKTALEVARVTNANALANAIIEHRERAYILARESASHLDSRQIRVIHSYDPDFPESLRRIKNPPGWLFVEGNIRLLSAPSVAIVGTRTPTRVGQFLTEAVCYLLKDTDLTTVSGLATGIDENVHSLSLSLRIPTIAVLGTGILRDYPASTGPLRAAIVARGGCIVSEYMPEDSPAKDKFVWRNRLQAGLADIVIPVEWQLKSGTAHTVQFALAADKPLIAVTVDKQPPESARYLVDHGAPIFRLPHEAPDLLEHICRVLG